MSDTPDKTTPAQEHFAESTSATGKLKLAPVVEPASAPAPVSQEPVRQEPAIEPSISFDDEIAENEVNVITIVIDAIAAATAIAFTVLLLQDALPFMN
ncbi:MAG: hypothetical protein ACPG3X_03085 [Opitutales bacterium]